MPLIVIAGVPSSGKTKRALQLKTYFEEQGKEVYIVNEEEQILKAGFDKNQFYNDASQEKDIRAHLKSEVQRLISPRNVVILDGSNYIKGYRYELYCVTKASHCTQCTLYPIIHNEEAWRLNEARDDGASKYSRTVFDALLLRFEEPDGRNRWDSPMFTVMQESDLDFQAISDSLFGKKAPPPNLSTQNPPLNATNYLHDMNKITKQIMTSIIMLIKSGTRGLVPVPGFEDLEIDLGSLTVQRLVSLNRQYLTYSKLNPPDIDNVPQLYVQFLTSNIN